MAAASKKEVPVAKNKPMGDKHRIGAVRTRSQVKMPNGHYVKRNMETGEFMDVKSDKKPFKGVRKER
jgi:hypothetical protein